MKLIISQLFMTTTQDGIDEWAKDHTKHPKGTYKGYVRKTIENPDVYPHMGDSISSSLWDRDFTEQKVMEVTFDYDEDECIVTLPIYYIVAGGPWDAEFDNIVTGHGWEVIRRK